VSLNADEDRKLVAIANEYGNGLDDMLEWILDRGLNNYFDNLE